MGEGAFAGTCAARYIMRKYHVGCNDILSEHDGQQGSRRFTIASGCAGGLAGNSTSAAGTGAHGGRNCSENNMLNLIATETAANTAAAIAGATGNASKDTGNDNGWDIGGGCEGSHQLGMDASKYSLQYSEKSIGYGMYQGGQMSSIPGTFGGFVGSFVSEGASSATQKEVDGDKK